MREDLSKGYGRLTDIKNVGYMVPLPNHHIFGLPQGAGPV